MTYKYGMSPHLLSNQHSLKDYLVMRNEAIKTSI